MKKRIAAVTGILFLAVVGCTASNNPQNVSAAVQVEDIYGAKEVDALAETSEKLTVWSAYWDCADDIRVIREKEDAIAEVSLFAAYFKDGGIMVPEATERMMKKIRHTNETKVYLSVVNDVEKSGTSTQKDTEILKTVLGNEGAARDHAKTLIRLAVCGGYDGIEIDYEKIRSDLELWDDFFCFEQILIAEAQKNNLGVRIILEPGIPVDELDFPEGAEYVVMCYNLYGGGTEPGPKADLAFLEEVYEKFHSIPDIAYALANGGYDWEEYSQKPVQRTREEIEDIIKENHAVLERDSESKAMRFSYMQGTKKHIVWYADETTLKLWAEKLNQLAGKKVKISYWRL